jgi:prolyl oligopeptidase
MHYKTLILLASLATASVVWAADDPFLWLENIDDEKSLDWVRSENQSTADRLKSGPLFDELYTEALSILNGASRLPSVNQKGDWLYNYWRDETNPRGVYRRTTLAEFANDAPKWEEVINMDSLSQKENKQWVFKGMSCLSDHPEHCIVQLSPGGGDAVVSREFNSVTKTFVNGGFHLPLAKGSVNWIDANTLFVSTDFGEGSMTDSGYPRIVKRWTRGTPLESAELLYEADVTSVSAGASVLHSAGADIEMLRDGKTFWTSQRYQLVDGNKKKLELPLSATVNGAFRGRLIFSLKEDWIHKNTTYSQGSVLIADMTALQTDGKGIIEVIIEPSDTTVVQSVATTDDTLLVTVLENVRGKIYRYQPGAEGSWKRTQVDFPDNGALQITSSDSKTGNFFARYESFTSPPALYYVASRDWQPQKIKSQAPSFDGSRYQTEQYFATSEDGTKVPYFVVLSKDAKRDGSNPTHIFSYGGFRVSLTPSYSGSYEALSGAYGKLWLDRGGVFVLANIRGGGEFGPQWHAAALKQNRHRAFEDFEAIAEDLVKRNITSPEHLGIEGRSNGGLLVGATMTRRPELYGAVICGVPLLDMQRYHKLLAGASWMAEYGDPDIPEQWAYIKEYSPYHKLAAGVDYPATFFYTSTRDDRVHPGHARKMAASMEAMGQEVWYYENLEGGHGGSSTNDQLAYRLALAYTHLWTQLK